MFNPPTAETLAAFNLKGEPVFLPGGEGRTYKVADAILKYIQPVSLQQAQWIADIFSQIEENGFRVARPIKTVQNSWVSVDSWSAWTLVEGTQSTPADVPQVIQAIQSFHQALGQFELPAFYSQILNNEYGRADAGAWGDLPTNILPDLRIPIEMLAALRIPLMDMTDQLIHGDLNPENILVAQGLAPAVIDLAPYYRPSEFSLAIYAYWVGPWRGDSSILEQFAHINHFKQMLIRAALRMLLIVSEFKKTELAERYLHATEIVRKFVTV